MTKTLLAQVRRVTRGRRERPDWYTIGLGVVIVAGFPIQVLIGLIGRSRGERGGEPVPALFVLAVAVIGILTVLAAAMAVGPLRISRAEYSTVLSAPVDRRLELRSRWVNSLSAAAVLGGAAAVPAALIAGAGGASAAWIGALGLFTGAATISSATTLQQQSAHARSRIQQAAALLGCVALLTVALAARSRVSWDPPAAVSVVAAVVGGVIAAGAGWAAWRSIALLDRAALMAGNALATAASAAVIFLDPALLGGALAQRQIAATRVSRSRSFARGRLRALLTADLVRSFRNRRAGGVYGVALLAVYAAATKLPAGWVPVLVLLAAAAAVSPFAAGLRQVCGSPVIRRMLGGSDAALRSVHLVMPVILAVVFAIAAMPAAPGHAVATLLVPVGVTANVWFRATGKPVEIGGAIADFGLGPVPVDLIRFIVRTVGPLAVVAYVQLNL